MAESNWSNDTSGRVNGAQMDCAWQLHTELDAPIGMRENGSQSHREI